MRRGHDQSGKENRRAAGKDVNRDIDLRYFGAWCEVVQNAMEILHPGKDWADPVVTLLEKEYNENRLDRGKVLVDWAVLEVELLKMVP